MVSATLNYLPQPLSHIISNNWTSSALMIKTLFAMLLSAFVIVHMAIAGVPDGTDAVRARLSALIPDLQPDSIKLTPVDSIYEVRYGAQILYLSADGRYYFRGSLVDLEQQKDLTEATRNNARVALLNKLDEQQMIVFSPQRPKHTVTVFTDIDCAYCRKLHSEIGQYLNEGIKVRYLAFPRAGINSPSYDKAVNVWCADDRNTALTKAKLDEPIPDKTCKNPVKAQMKLGRLIGVSGTPAIVLEDGEMIPGYQSPRALAATLATLDGSTRSQAKN
jgi:thiol:disulfide interchange protein DsbC